MAKSLCFFAIDTLPEIKAGMQIDTMLWQALQRQGLSLLEGDILVITHKILSKALGLVHPLSAVRKVSPLAEKAAQHCQKDPRLVQLVLDDAETTYLCPRNILLSVRKDGWVCCNAGIDQSNTGSDAHVVHLPEDNDALAKQLSDCISAAAGFAVPVLICDTHGRVLRNGTTGVVIGSYGIAPIRTYLGECDRDAHALLCTKEAVADELAGAATLLMGQGNEGIPAVVVRGSGLSFCEIDSTPLKRPPTQQLYQPVGIALHNLEDIN